MVLGHGLIISKKGLCSSKPSLAGESGRRVLIVLSKPRWRLWVSGAWGFVLLLGGNLLAVKQVLLVAMRRQHDGYNEQTNYSRLFLLNKAIRLAVSSSSAVIRGVISRAGNRHLSPRQLGLHAGMFCWSAVAGRATVACNLKLEGAGM